MSSCGIHLLLGPDRPRKLQRIHEFERALAVTAFDRHHVDGAGVTGAELLALCRQLPAASSRRLIVVDEAHKLDRAVIEALRGYAEVIAATACVALMTETELTSRHALAALLTDTRIATEQFPGRGGPAARPFALTEALGRLDAAAALGAVREQVAAGKEPLEIFGLVAWQLQRWVWVRRLLDAGMGLERIVSVTNLKLWQVERLSQEVARWPLGLLQMLLERCWRLEADAKSGRHVPELALEEIILRVCAPEMALVAEWQSGRAT